MVTDIKYADLAPEHPLFTETVVPHLLEWRRAGIPSALVTLVGVEGSSPRRPGSQLTVNVHGDYVGHISSGCAEAAIVAEAVNVIKDGVARAVRYGNGSKYVDVVLPCGSGLDLVFDPVITTTTLECVASAVAERRTVALAIDPAARVSAAIIHQDAQADLNSDQLFIRRYVPAVRVVIAGRSVHVDFMARLAKDLEWDVQIVSPDKAVLARLSPVAQGSQHLTRPEDFDASVLDAHSAMVLLFHDHGWEPQLLARCAQTPAFYVGAMGSRRTHAQRILLLQELGLDQAFIARVHGPAGLSLDARNPAEIALAITAQILTLTPRPGLRS